ncbi:hypothetical protein [Actinosynnema sp. NPDC023587]|uniref:hypothetical protein n=1 Tax=Actinosynnema sp. NPDC023587 TaxID=3154695 RepID=UPI0033D7C6BB
MAAGNLIAGPLRLHGVWRPLLPALLLVTACSGEPRLGCTLMAGPEGVELDVQLDTARTGTIEVCWDGRCVAPPLNLVARNPLTPGSCASDETAAACGPSAVPSGWRMGHAAVPDLPDKQVTVRLKLVDDAGAVVVDRELTATPERVYPNGAHCEPGDPLLALKVGPDGSVVQQ